MQVNRCIYNNLSPFVGLIGAGEIIFPEAVARQEARI